MASGAITRKVPRSLFDDPDFWNPPDAIDEDERIRQWHENNIDIDEYSEESESFYYAEQNHLSPNL